MPPTLPKTSSVTPPITPRADSEPTNAAGTEPPSFTRAASDAKTENAAARTIQGALRRHIAKPAFERMSTRGSNWKGQTEKGVAMIAALSKKNIDGLKSFLGPLTPSESGFLERFMSTPMYATHATAGPVKQDSGVVTLFSRVKALSRRVDIPLENTQEFDLTHLANDDFVFFSLEFGDSFSKPESRFGKSMFRFDAESPAFHQAGWATLTDMLDLTTPMAKKHVEGISNDDAYNLSNRDVLLADTIFKGPDVKYGIALSIMADLRAHASAEGRENMLSASTPAAMNGLMNGIFRPEMKVARHFFSSQFEERTTPPPDATP